MKRTTWGRINELFEAARRLPADERDAWVRAATSDERLREEVLSLLHAHEDDPWSIDEPGGTRAPSGTPPQPEPAGRPTPTPSSSWPAAPSPGGPSSTPHAAARDSRASVPAAGSQFGSYRLVREVARDAARAIFEAVATGAGPHPRVALHLLAIDTRDPVAAAVLHDDGHVLERLGHPAIPRLLDGGVAADGTAYLAFELAAGEPIDGWCRDRDLSLQERVRHVLAVCDAVEHVHQHLVAHGDLRPASILVSGAGEVKVLDCGMARILASGPAPAAPPAHLYASPEQARGEALTTASDVYALGVLLYVLLTGYPPYELGGQAPARARQIICGVEPELPSRVVVKPQRRALAAHLDHIIMNALRKDPGERYGSVTALAADLRAWLDRRPISVVPAAGRSRIVPAGGGRALRTSAAAIAVAALMAGAGLLAWQAWLMRAERDQLRVRLVEARHFSQGIIFDLHDAVRTLPGSAEARQAMLDRAIAFMDTVAKDPGTDPALALELAEGYRRAAAIQAPARGEGPAIGRQAAARSLAASVTAGERALAAAPASLPAVMTLAGAYGDLAALRLQLDDREGAERADARQRALVQQLAREHPKDGAARAAVASGYAQLGAFREAGGDTAAARVMYGEAIAGFEALSAEGDPPASAPRELARARRRLGAVALHDGDFDEAERLLLAAQAFDKEEADRQPPDAEYRREMVETVSDLALVARRRGDLAKAEPLWVQALSGIQASLDADPGDVRALAGVADVRASLASLCRSQRRFEEALVHYREALRFRERAATAYAAPPASAVALAGARTDVARVLLDLVEVRRPGPADGARLREAGALLAQALPAARDAASSSPALEDMPAEVDRQTARLRRLTIERQ